MQHGVREGGPGGANMFMGYPVVSAAGYTAAGLMAVLARLLPLTIFARGAVYKGKSPAGQMTSIAEDVTQLCAGPGPLRRQLQVRGRRRRRRRGRVARRHRRQLR